MAKRFSRYKRGLHYCTSASQGFLRPPVKGVANSVHVFFQYLTPTEGCARDKSLFFMKNMNYYLRFLMLTIAMLLSTQLVKAYIFNISCEPVTIDGVYYSPVSANDNWDWAETPADHDWQRRAVDWRLHFLHL